MSITHKRGDTFAYAGPLPDGVDFTGATATSQIKTRSGKLIADLDVTLDAGVLRLRKQHTADWPLDRAAELDVQFVFPSGDIVSTETVTVPIIPDITQP